LDYGIGSGICKELVELVEILVEIELVEIVQRGNRRDRRQTSVVMQSLFYIRVETETLSHSNFLV
jgi:hypothetical protein